MKEKQLQDITALYGRLSRDDEVGGESMSMDEQKKPRAWVYARIPGDYDGTMNSFKVCSIWHIQKLSR